MTFPVGSSVLVIGVALFSENTKIQLVSLIALPPILVAICFSFLQYLELIEARPFLVPGGGWGVLLLVFAFLVWQWGSARTGLQPAERAIADVKMAWYLFLMIGVRQTC